MSVMKFYADYVNTKICLQNKNATNERGRMKSKHHLMIFMEVFMFFIVFICVDSCTNDANNEQKKYPRKKCANTK